MKKTMKWLIPSVIAFALVVIAAVIILIFAKPSNNGADDFSFTVDPVRVHEYNESDVPVRSEEESNHIMKAAAVGSWTRALEKDMTVGLRFAYDMKPGTRWNPQANSKYVGDPGVVFLLDGYYDLSSWSMQLDKREYFFDLYVSEDGEEYTLLKQINAENSSEFYNEKFLFTIDNLDVKNIAFVKVVFTGAKDGSNFVNLHEVSFTGTFVAQGPWEIPEWVDSNAAPETLIASHSIVGNWKNDLAKDTAYGPKMSYDENVYSRWNPEGNPGFAGNPGIVYTLKRAINIRKIQFVFNTAHHYFDVYVSKDGNSYTKVANIHSLNAGKAYTQGDNGTLLCTLDGLQLDGIQYVKLIFTGRPNGNTFVNLLEVIISESGAEGVDTSWMLMSGKPAGSITIQSHKTIGAWEDDRSALAASPDKSYDGDLQTKWNPIAADNRFSGEPGIIYTLSKAASIKKMIFTYGTDMHWFDVYVSSNGEEFTQIASISDANADKAYTDGTNGNKICTLDGLSLKNVKYIKVVYTGRVTPNNRYLNIVEASFSLTGSSGLDTTWMLPDDSGENNDELTINAHQTIGAWEDDRGALAASPDKSYDGDLQTKWNPIVASDDFTGDPGIIYTLNKTATVRKMVLTLGSEMHWFDVYVSSNGEEFTQIASISVANADKAYTDGENANKICTLDGLYLADIRYVKLTFNGRATPNNRYLNIVEVQISENGTEGLDTSWMLPGVPEEPDDTNPDEQEEIKAIVISGTLTGGWKTLGDLTKAYDGSTSTRWNPQSTGFESEESAIFTLDKAYNLTKLQITVGSRYHYFIISVSADGNEYAQIADVNASNYSTYYLTDYVCTVGDINAENVQYVKVQFTGNSATSPNAFVNFDEIEVYGVVYTDTETPEPSEPENTEPDVTEPEATEPEATEPEVTEPETTEPVSREEVKAVITGGSLTGGWKTPGDITKAYDGSTSTRWNPQSTGFESAESVIFNLDKAYDLTRLQITVGSRYHYFVISVSTDGEVYIPIADVNASNYGTYYLTNYVCTVSDITADKIKYIKITFTGNSATSPNAWVNFDEIEVYGKENGTE